MSMSADRPLSFAIIGCGLIGKKRAAALSGIQGARLKVACDLDPKRAEEAARIAPGCVTEGDFLKAVADPTVDAVIVSTLNASLAPIALAAIQAGKHVLIEKPAALAAAGLRELEKAASAGRVRVRLGYNHRFHPGMLKAREIHDSGVLGPLMFLR